jgi:hypothetical protein
MSFGVQRARAFLDPLRGKITTFFVADRLVNLSLSTLILTCVTAAGAACEVVDMDAFYASNSDLLSAALPREGLERVSLYVPKVGTSGDDLVMKLFDRGQQPHKDILILDDLNTLFHLLSSDNSSSAGRKLAFLIALQSFVRRTNRTTALATVYEREKPIPGRRSKSFSELADTNVSVAHSGDELILKCERGAAWPGGTLSFPILSSG